MSRLPFRPKSQATVFLAPEALAPLVANRSGTLTVPIPPDLLHIETLPGEDGPSAWVIERYMEGGEARQQCTRREPFGGAQSLWLKVKCKRAAHYFGVKGYRVEQDGKAWVFRVEVAS